ncbi:MAG: hypothetical protein LBJ70_03765 [Holosporales bacterium]|jgi:hypothetical protein|nr:hypothetical protein [Holosporales bacterium]
MMVQVQRMFGGANSLEGFCALQASLASPEQTQPLGAGDFDALQASLEDPERIRSSGLKGEVQQRTLLDPSAEGPFAHLASDNA